MKAARVKAKRGPSMESLRSIIGVMEIHRIRGYYAMRSLPGYKFNNSYISHKRDFTCYTTSQVKNYTENFTRCYCDGCRQGVIELVLRDEYPKESLDYWQEGLPNV